MKSKYDLAWAAGFFDGEGSFIFSKSRKHRSTSISISQADRFVLDKFRDIVDCGTVGGPYGPYNNGISIKPQYKFRVNSLREFNIVYRSIKPWLSPIKIAQAELVLEKYSRYKDNRRKLSLEQIDEIRLRLLNKELAINIARDYNIDHRTISYHKIKNGW